MKMKRQGPDTIGSNKKKKPALHADDPSQSLLLHELLAKAVPLNQSNEFPILLNDKHASKYSEGSSVWLKAKREERVEVEQKMSGRRSLASRINRVVEIFRQELNLPDDYQPHFWYKLVETEIKGDLRNQTIGKVGEYASLYVECSLQDEKVLSNVRSFRLSKTPTRTAKKRLSFPEYPSTPRHRKVDDAAKQNLCATPAHSIITGNRPQGLPTTTPSSLSSEESYFGRATAVTPEGIPPTENTDSDSITPANCLQPTNDPDTCVKKNDWVDDSNSRDHVCIGRDLLAAQDLNEMSESDSYRCGFNKDWNPNIKLEVSSGKLLESLTKHSSLSAADAMNAIMSSFPDAFSYGKGPQTFQISPIKRRRQIVHPPILDDGSDSDNCENTVNMLSFPNGLNFSVENHPLDGPEDLIDFIQDVSPVKI